MNNIIEIPLQATNQEFDIQLGNKNYHLKTTYREFNGWMLDIQTQSKEDILMGIPLLHGIDIFEQYRYLGLDGRLVYYCDEPENELKLHGGKLYFM